jgi:hypothetical protein
LHNHVLTSYLLGSARYAFDGRRWLTPYMSQDGRVQFQPVYDEAMRHAGPAAPDDGRRVARAQRSPCQHGANLLFEGAQGTLARRRPRHLSLCDVQQLRGRQRGRRIGRRAGLLHYVLGITKAYCTRVGGGPFPTELDWEKPGTPGYHMSTVGAEKGVTTGRARRCGWFDAALLKRSAQVNGLSGLCITKLDVLDGLKKLNLCTGYELDGETASTSCPWGPTTSRAASPSTRTMQGWSESTVGVTRYDALPIAARLYLQRIEQVVGRADPHGLDQPGSRPHYHDAPPVPGRLGPSPPALDEKAPTSTTRPGRITSMLTEDGKHLYVSYDEYHNLIEKLAIRIHQSGWQFDTILCLARGGMRPGDILSRIFDKPLAIMSTSSYRAEAGTQQGQSGHRALHHDAQGRDRRQGAAGR